MMAARYGSPCDEIVARREGKSSMPDDLVQQISRRQLRDLVTYLASLQADPREAGANRIASLRPSA